ncbi:MAG: glucosamine-6-phosphate deaminase [Enterocloster sp.]
MDTIKYFVKDQLQCFIYEDRQKMGSAAARDILAAMHILLSQKETINVMFAAAPSQNEILAGLAADTSLDWSRINAFHMDEYIGLRPDAPQGFGNFLREHIFRHKPFRSVSYISPEAADPDAEAKRYEQLLLEHPIDLCMMGVGENGHLAFNDPAVADFHDTRIVKPVKLDLTCRQQQVNDGCFQSLDQVPEYAITVTIPGLMRAPALFCIVPAQTKAKAIASLINGPVSESCPSSILRTRPTARLYMDPDSSSLL